LKRKKREKSEKKEWRGGREIKAQYSSSRPLLRRGPCQRAGCGNPRFLGRLKHVNDKKLTRGGREVNSGRNSLVYQPVCYLEIQRRRGSKTGSRKVVYADLRLRRWEPKKRVKKSEGLRKKATTI